MEMAFFSLENALILNMGNQAFKNITIVISGKNVGIIGYLLPVRDVLVSWYTCMVNTGPKVVKLFSCSTQLSIKLILLINCWHFNYYMYYHNKCLALMVTT